MSTVTNYGAGAVTLTPDTSARNVVQAGGVGVVAFTAKGAAGQTGDLQQWQNSGGTILTRVQADGTFVAPYLRGTYIDGSPSSAFFDLTTSSMAIVARAAASVVFITKGTGSQTADLQQWQNTGGTALHAVTAAGLPRWIAAATVQTTVGAAGGASALPATPTKYLKVVDDGGTTLVVPAYAAA